MRIVTRGDLDGLTSSVLLSETNRISGVELVHPQDISNKSFSVGPRDILANLPYAPGCCMWFDHHAHTTMPQGEFMGKYAIAPSVARVIYEYYGAEALARFERLVSETDRFDSADLTREDVLNPQGVMLLGFLIDPRTGMTKDFKPLFLSLMDRLRTMSAEEVLLDLDMKQRTAVYRENIAKFHDFLLANSEVDGNVVVTDFRGLDHAPVGNRFLIYTTFPHCNVSVRVQWGPGRKFVAVNIGHSIFDRSCSVDVGRLCREHGGGGHRGAGACVIDTANADLEIHDIIERLIED